MTAPFRLDPVLRQRKRVEEERAAELAVTTRRRDAAAERLEAQTVETVTLTGEVTAAGLEGATGGELAARAELAERSSRWTGAAAAQLATEETEVDARRTALVHAAQDRRLLERLREIRREEAARQRQQREQREYDDLASANRLWRRTDAGAAGGAA